MRIIDTHAHLSDLQDREGVIERAKAIGIEAIVAVGANLETCKATLKWAQEFPGYVHPALGIHATEWMDDDVQETLKFIREMIGECVAVGEIGLDYWNSEARKNKEVRARQREIYVEQLGIAVEHGKPASIHGRGSWKDALDLAKKHGPEQIVFHWYSGPLDVLGELLDSGYYISATPASEFSKHHRAALSEAPLESIVVETDSPVSYHGKLAEPSDILLTLKSLAELKGIPVEEVAQVTTMTAKQIFDI